MIRKKLPYGRQSIDSQDIAAVVRVLQSEFLTGGEAVETFEFALAKLFTVEKTVSCSSGTAALHLASMGMLIGQDPNDVVIIPAITFSATANAPFMCGAKVVFADVDPHTGLMGLAHLEDAYFRAKEVGTPKAVFPVHLNGQMAPMQELAGFAKENNLIVIEDACHALGGKYLSDNSWKTIGDAAFSDAVCFSFHPVKTIAMGEGGAVSSRNEGFLKRISELRNHGITRNPAEFTEKHQSISPSGTLNPWYYEMQQLGSNYRSSDIHCALGESQLKKLSSFIEKRSLLMTHYKKRLTNASVNLKMLNQMNHQIPAWHLMVVLIDFSTVNFDRAQVVQKLRTKNIYTQVHYIPVPWQPFWRNQVQTPTLPGTKQYYERALSLPLFYDMSETDVNFVCDALLDILSK